METVETPKHLTLDDVRRSTDPLTAEQYAEVCDLFDGPTELAKGKIIEMVRPRPIHGVVIKNISGVLWNWVRSGDHGAIDGESGLVTARDPDSVRGPDVFFVPTAQLVDGKVPEHWYEVAPKLVVEVLSSNDRWTEVHQKIEEYLAFGVEEVWVIEPEIRRLDVIRKNESNVSFVGDVVVTSEVLPGFSAPLSDFFYRC